MNKKIIIFHDVSYIFMLYRIFLYLKRKDITSWIIYQKIDFCVSAIL